MEGTIEKRKILSRCPGCGNINLDRERSRDDISPTRYVTVIKCSVCGLTGIGEGMRSAYDDMIARAPLYSLEETLSAKLGTMIVEFDDLEKTLGQFVRTMEVFIQGSFSHDDNREA